MRKDIVMHYRDTHGSRRVAFSLGVLFLIASVLAVPSPIRGERSQGKSVDHPTGDAETSAGLPRIGTSDTVIYIETKMLGPIPAPVIITIVNETDIGVLQWSIYEDRFWLAASPNSAASNERDMQVFLTTTDITLGQRTGHLVISSSNAINAPETVTVFLQVLCPIEITGDCNGDGNLTQGDIIYLVQNLLNGGPVPRPLPEAGDVNCDGNLALSDVIYLVNYILRGGPSPCNVCSLLDAGSSSNRD